MRGDEAGAGMRQRFGALVIDRDAHEVTLDGTPVPLTKAEFALLSTLAANPRRALSSRDLLRAMWGSEWSADTTALQVHVSRLRAKLNENGSRPRHIVTVHGFGYRFDPDPHGSPRMLDPDPRPRTVELVIDRDLVLRSVLPHEPFLGFDPDEIIGTFFSPTGLDETSLRGFIDALVNTGTLRTDSAVPLLDAAGQRVTVRQVATIHLDAGGAFDHLVSILTLPW